MNDRSHMPHQTGLPHITMRDRVWHVYTIRRLGMFINPKFEDACASARIAFAAQGGTRAPVEGRKLT